MARYKSVLFAGTPFSGTTIVANMLSAETSWPLYQGIRGIEGASPEKLRRSANEVAERAKRGNVVIESIYPVYLDQTTFRVFIGALITTRTRRAIKSPRIGTREEFAGLPPKQIERVLLLRENDEASIGKALFGIDYRSHAGYDLVIYNDNMSAGQTFAKVLRELRRTG